METKLSPLKIVLRSIDFWYRSVWRPQFFCYHWNKVKKHVLYKVFCTTYSATLLGQLCPITQWMSLMSWFILVNQKRSWIN